MNHSTKVPSLFFFFRKHLRVYLLGALMLVAFQLSMNRIDWLSKIAVDRIFSSEGVSQTAWHLLLWMGVLAVIAFLVRLASRWFIFFAGRDIEYELRKRFLSQLYRLGSAFYRKMPAGDIMSRGTNDLMQVRLLMGFGVMNLINVGLALVSALQVMLSISWKLTVVSLSILPMLLLITRLFSGRMFAGNRKNQEAIGALSSFLQSHLSGIRVIRSFALDVAQLGRFDQANEAYLKASLYLARVRGALGPLSGAISALGLLLFFWYGGRLLLLGPQQGGITPGGFFAFSLALARMTWPMIALGFVMSILQRGRAGYARLKEILDEEPETKDGPLQAPKNIQGALHVKNLSFLYGTKRVLSEVTFSVPAGGSIAVVGRTGSGKSTLALLLTRLLPTPKGAVFIEGYDICDLPLSFVRQTIGYAQQEAFLFSTTISRNIGFALPETDSPSAVHLIERAAQEAQILEEIQHLPEEFDTIVGERGIQLSGGQKQRISLARALLSQSKLLLLDDPLSAVDAKTEKAILETLSRQLKRTGLLLITHRVMAASICDHILVLDEGKIIEQGTHEELLKHGGLYSEFAKEQKIEQELALLSEEPLLESSTTQGEK